MIESGLIDNADTQVSAMHLEQIGCFQERLQVFTNKVNRSDGVFSRNDCKYLLTRADGVFSRPGAVLGTVPHEISVSQVVSFVTRVHS